MWDLQVRIPKLELMNITIAVIIGQTDNESNRLKRHNQELPCKSTSFTYKNKGPWKVIYEEFCSNRSEAIKRENKLKSHKGRDWLRKNILKGP